ncbi:uncharacterized protein LOC143793116 isoform X1 [Ranitomeya variabilis]|uniref:uncharacterized protein LOC143793116 isoform X1 n=1 Tax=Ranitomeya variabilis TaxID=490064 RepID=UPI0040568568
MDEIKLIQSWSRYNNRIQALQQSIGLPSLQMSKPTFHKSGSPKPDDTPRKIFQSGQQHMKGSELQREVLKHCGPSAFDAMMESYSKDPTPGSPPMQKMLDKVLIRRSMEQAHRQKHHNEVIRKLEAAKEHLRKELKNLEAQNDFFGNGMFLPIIEGSYALFPHISISGHGHRTTIAKYGQEPGDRATRSGKSENVHYCLADSWTGERTRYSLQTQVLIQQDSMAIVGLDV